MIQKIMFSKVYAVAQGQVEVPKPDQVQIVDIGRLISSFIGILMIVAALAFFFMLVLGGLQWILSGGDKAGTEGARSRITAALIGLVIVFAAWAIVRLIEFFFGITILGTEFALPKPY